MVDRHGDLTAKFPWSFVSSQWLPFHYHLYIMPPPCSANAVGGGGGGGGGGHNVTHIILLTSSLRRNTFLFEVYYTNKQKLKIPLTGMTNQL